MEARLKVKSIRAAKKTAMKLGAEFKGEYSFTDWIYRNDNRVMRVRVVHESNWDGEPVIVTQKNCVYEGNAKCSEIILSKEFSVLSRAIDYINEIFPDYDLVYDYSRKGLQYDLGESSIFIENIDKLGPSVEIEGDTELISNFPGSVLDKPMADIMTELQ